MGKYVVFGAGGRAGQQVVAEARRRGHEVTAVVRDPSRYDGLTDGGVRVAALAAGCDAAINTAAALTPETFFASAARALIKGLHQAGVERLVAGGIAMLLPGPDGTRLVDTPDFPAEYRPFSLSHAVGLEVLRVEGGSLDWVYISPAGDFDHDGERTGRFEFREHVDTAARISYADFAIVLLDEAQTPTRHRSHLAVT